MPPGEIPTPTTLRPSQKIKAMFDGRIPKVPGLYKYKPPDVYTHPKLTDDRGHVPPAKPTVLRDRLMDPTLEYKLISSPKRVEYFFEVLDEFRGNILKLLDSPDLWDKDLMRNIVPLFQAFPGGILEFLERMSNKDPRLVLSGTERVANLLHKIIQEDKLPDAANYLGDTFALASKTYHDISYNKPEEKSAAEQYRRIVYLIGSTDFGTLEQFRRNKEVIITTLKKYQDIIPLSKPVIDRLLDPERAGEFPPEELKALHRL
ncbi:hypothetical protein MUP32_01575, partial [Candidatus Microgenomates bacterium]|nr:hypothetical protein [Candidatus Microgenomates bacterium]